MWQVFARISQAAQDRLIFAFVGLRWGCPSARFFPGAAAFAGYPVGSCCASASMTARAPVPAEAPGLRFQNMQTS